MRHVFQPRGSGYCGQACVAMIAGVDLDEVIRITKTVGGGTTRIELARSLRNYGFSVGRKMIRATGKIKGTAIARLNHPTGKRWHWVVVHNSKLYDPSPYGLTTFKITSYLPVRRRNEDNKS